MRSSPRSPAAAPARATVPFLLLLLALPFGASGCYPPQMLTLRSGLDSLRTVIDTMQVRDSITYRVLLETRRDIAEQKDVLLSTRATAGTTTQQLFEQMSRLEARLEEVTGRFDRISARQPTPTAPPPATSPATPQGPAGPVAPPAGPAVRPPTFSGDPGVLYDQAALDLTQGRYSMALEGFRELVRRFPTHELADNAQYGVGECFFAQAHFDSASVEYARVEASWPQGDKVPAALYKLALCQERLQKAAESKKTLEDLVKRFPLSGEAQLARERLGSGHR